MLSTRHASRVRVAPPAPARLGAGLRLRARPWPGVQPDTLVLCRLVTSGGGAGPTSVIFSSASQHRGQRPAGSRPPRASAANRRSRRSEALEVGLKVDEKGQRRVFK